jgi:hypothetical protein
MRTNRLILAATIAVGGMGFINHACADDGTQTTGQQTQNAADRAADKTDSAASSAGNAIRRTADRLTTGSTTQPDADVAMAPDAKDIRETLKEVTQAAFTKGGFDDLIERFVDSDRARLNRDVYTNQNHDILDAKISQFRDDWKAKYNQDFKIDDKNAVYDSSFAMIMQHQNGDAAQMAAEHQTADDTNKQMTTEKTQPGRSVATVTIAASHRMPELTVPMIHEFPDRWKIDVPDNLTAQQLHDRLLNQVTMLDEHKDSWPEDVNEAYRAVTHHILMAVMGDTHVKNSEMNH